MPRHPSSPPSNPPSTPQSPQHDSGIALAALPVREKLKPPSMFQVVMLNDDFTPMEFVVMVLGAVFNKDHDTATRIMLQVHMQGRAVCGVYPRDIAQTKTDQVLRAARADGHPLQCVVEPVE